MSKPFLSIQIIKGLWADWKTRASNQERALKSISPPSEPRPVPQGLSTEVGTDDSDFWIVTQVSSHSNGYAADDERPPR